MKRPLSRPWRWMLAVLVTLTPIAGAAQEQPRDERAVKAAFVFNLTKYVEWPQKNEEIVIGFVGVSQTGEILRKMLNGKTSDSRVIRVLLSPSEPDIARCSILYIADPSPKNVRAALEQARGKSILTVGDTETFVRQGGMIGLVTVGEQIQIQIGLENAQAARLKISSRLLNIATLIRPTSDMAN
ncbi:MAG TPA: YfiR family protein [Dongiaceae bacterium]|nr:YfiR family protein [Dongiaceae bacterium]